MNVCMMQGLSPIGRCDKAHDGNEAIAAFNKAWQANDPYELLTLDIMMPNLDGMEALKRIRAIEKQMQVDESKRIKVIMTTALGNPQNVIKAFYEGGAMAYIVKPVVREVLMNELKKMGIETQ